MIRLPINSTELRVLLIRPGMTDLDEQGRITGNLDIPLSDRGETQAEKMAGELADIKLDVIVSGPSLAAQQTAVYLAKDRPAKVRVEAGLVNLNHGLWQGMKIEELQENQPRVYRSWIESPDSICPPGGEQPGETVPRVTKRAIRKILKTS